MPPKAFDESITPDDTYSLIHQTILENGLNSDPINSMNDFYSVGLHQIIKHIFSIKDTFINQRDKTPEDKAIERIRYEATFTNVRLTPPTMNGYQSGTEKMLYPLEATTSDRSYTCGASVDMTIEAWAYARGTEGKTQHIKAEIKDHKLGNIQAMVGTSVCNLYGKSKAALKQINENPYSSGGYFICSGKEWSVDNIESVANNQERVYRNDYQSEVVRLEFISKPGDTYQNSKQNIIRFLNNGAITIELGSPQIKGVQLPFYLLLRALGMQHDKRIFEDIMQIPIGTASMERKLDPVSHEIDVILTRAMFADYDAKMANKFGRATYQHGVVNVAQYIVTRLPPETFRDMDLTKDDHLHQAVNDFMAMLDANMPHIGEGSDTRMEKARFYCHLIRQTIMVYLKLNNPTDRDSYATKRVHPAGVSMAKVFKTHFGQVVSNARRQLLKDFKSTPFKSINLAQSLKIALGSTDLSRGMEQSITSGNKTEIVTKNRKITNRLSSQLLDHKNILKDVGIGRMIISPSGDSSKGSERAKEMRMPHPSFHGFACLIQSPEGGDKVGLHKQTALSAHISTYGSSEVLTSVLLADANIHKMNPDRSYEPPSWRRVYVNGKWIGSTENTAALVSHYTWERRAGRIDRHTTIQWNNENDEVSFWVDPGRMCRPILIVVNNYRDWKFLGLTEPAKIEDFQQWIVLTRGMVMAVREGKQNLETWYKAGVFEWLTPGEQIRSYVAVDINHLRKYRRDPLHQFTHCDIPEAMLGLAALTGTLNNYNHTPRNTFQASQVRQAGSIYAPNWPYRIDKDTFVMHEPSRPLTHSRVNDYINNNGCTTKTAVMVYTGYNEEDSQVWGQFVADRLKFNGCWRNYDKVEIDKNELIGRPNQSKTTGIKKYANYGKLDEKGLLPHGTIVYKNDVVVGKFRKLTKQDAAKYQMDYSDTSLIYKNEFPSIVDVVIQSKDGSAIPFIKIGYISLKPIVIGDKFSARSGQKGICGLLVPQSDMPFDEDGSSVDMIMNPHSFPKRMTNGQPIESQISNICVKRGVTCDLTTFRKIDLDDTIEECKRLGLELYGRKRLYCGLTGNHIDALIFTGFINYQRLQKFVAKSIYSIDVGPTDIITRQPLDGKANQGGLRISELQRDVILAHGASRMFSEKMYDHSDGFEVHVCRCGNYAILNEDEDLYNCKECGDSADINIIPSCWSSKQLFMELNAMGIVCTFGTEPPTYYEQS